jgi:hypothetical protein
MAASARVFWSIPSISRRSRVLFTPH